MSGTIVQQAHGLAQSGQTKEAAALLHQAAAQGDAAAMLMLGLWHIEGQALTRDLPVARDWIGRAASLGLQAAARIEAALCVTGVGTASDWAGALAVLRQWSDRDPIASRQLALIDAAGPDAAGDPSNIPAAEPLSASPHVLRVPGLFSTAECTYLIEQAATRFQPARIFHEGQQRFQPDPVRNSDNAGFPFIFESPLIHMLNRRIAQVSGTDVAQAETLQLLRYSTGQEYRLHLDAVPGLANQRIMTVLVYLNDDYDGGATSFPDLGIDHRGGIGDALIFANTLPDGRPDPATRHMGSPVTRGTKFVASRWIRQRPPPPGEAFGPHEAMPGSA